MKTIRKPYEERLKRRFRLSVAQAASGAVMLVLSFCIRADSGWSYDLRQAWTAFWTTTASLLLCLGGSRAFQCRKLLNNDFLREKAQIEEEDERGRLLKQMVWAGMGRVMLALILIAMLTALCLTIISLRVWYEKRL